MKYEDAIIRIKERIKLVDVARRYVDLKRHGPRWMAPCPFHQETKPSFSINEEDGLFYCFGCQASGDLFSFYGRINGTDFKETLEQLAAEAGITLDSPRGGQRNEAGREENVSRRKLSLRMHELAAAHFTRNLSGSQGNNCRKYLDKRGLSPEIINTFGLGYSLDEWQDLATVIKRAGFSEKDAVAAGLLGISDKSGRAYDRFRGRLMFPIKSLSNQIIAFGGRILAGEDEAKYINSADSPIYKKGEHLFGLAQARRNINIKKEAILTEGYMDVLTLHQYGYGNAIGVLGTALTPEQLKKIAGFTSNLLLVFDGDRAGRAAALRACEMILIKGMACKVVNPPDGEDIDSFLRGPGPEAFDKLCGSAPDGLKFCMGVLKDQAPREAVDWTRNFLRKLEIPELAGRYASMLAGWLNLSEEELRGGLTVTAGRGWTRGTGVADPAETAPGGKMSPKATRERQILMFAVRYPQRFEDLRAAGADVALGSDVALRLWRKLEDTDPELVFHELDEREKNFWVQCRAGMEAAPRDSEERELAELLRNLEAFHAATHKSSISAAIRENAGTGDFETDLEYLRVLQETLGRGNEQS